MHRVEPGQHRLQAGAELLVGSKPPLIASANLRAVSRASDAGAYSLTSATAARIRTGALRAAAAEAGDHSGGLLLPPNRRGLFGSFSNMASGLATLVATGAAAIVTTALTAGELAAWGWRIPFIVGGVLGVVGLILRARADETQEFEASSLVDKKSAPARLLALLREHPKALLQTASLSAPAVAYDTWATFLPTYAQLTSGRDKSSTLIGSVIGLCLLVIVVPICGALSDKLGRRKIFPIVGAIGMIVLFYPLLLLLQRPGFWVYVGVAVSGWLVLGIWQAIYPTIQGRGADESI
jgi:MHS family alpha-ketoglutarate permease-like MFS transporter